jgi:hypothetical protein
MEHLSELLNFFGNASLDRHRLLQGSWSAYRIEWDDPDGWSDSPLELLLTILVEELQNELSDATPALRALDALAATALPSLSRPEFDSIRRSFWYGFQFVAESVAKERGVVFHELSRDDIRNLIESKYERHAA